MNRYMLLFITINTFLSVNTWSHETRGDTNNRQVKDVVSRKLESDRSVNQFNSRNIEFLAARGGFDDDEIVFPSTSSKKFKETVEYNETYFAAGKGFGCIDSVCDYAKDYPTKHIQKIIGSSNYANLFGHLEGNIVDTGTRTGGDEIGTSLCISATYLKFPKTLKNENSTEKFIVNMEGYKQGVTLTECRNPTGRTGQCNTVASFPTGYVTECVQEYARIRFLAVEGNSGSLGFDVFPIPSCCICRFREIKV